MASEKEHEDLFWALRGGGGNFGVVTSFEYQLHPVKDIFAGIFFYPLERAGDVLEFYRDYIADAPEQMGAFPAFQIAPPLPFIPESEHGKTFCAIVSCWAGPLDEGEKALEPIRTATPTVAEMVTPMPYPALNSAFDPLVPPGLQHYWKASFASELTDGAIAAHIEHGPQVPVVSPSLRRTSRRVRLMLGCSAGGRAGPWTGGPAGEPWPARRAGSGQLQCTGRGGSGS